MLENIIGSKSKISIIRTLFENQDKEYTIRKISIDSNTPYSVTHRDIDILCDENFIKVSRKGQNKIIKLNENHKSYNQISYLFSDKDSENKPKKIFKNKEAIIMVHHNADPDAIGSSIALARGLHQSGMECNIYAPDGISSQSKRLLEKYPYPIEYNIDDYPSLVFIIDTSSPEQISNKHLDIPESSKIVIIDHHEPGKLSDFADLKIVDPKAHSSAVLVYDLLNKAGTKITSEIAFFLMAAIVADTGHFRMIDKRDMRIVTDLIEKINIEDVFAALSTRISYDEKIARIECIKAARIYKLNDKIIIFSESRSYESRISRYFIESFADIAIVYNRSESSIRISGRARRYLKDRIDLSLVFKGIGKDINGNGGGHDIVASANGSDPEGIDRSIEKIKGYIETVFKGDLKNL